MKKFAGRWSRTVCGSSGLSAFVLIFLAGLMANIARSQTSFSTPQVLDGTATWGSVTNDNTGNVPDPGFLGVAGNFPYAPVWYQWTPQQDGEVELDTYGSSATGLTFVFDPINLIYVPATVTNTADTVLGVYTGSSPSTLSQVAANDDLYPYSNPAQVNYIRSDQDLSIFFIGSFFGDFPVTQPYGGPSGLRFNAKAGTTYYIAVDSKFASGPTVLNFAYHPSGVFRFATEDMLVSQESLFSLSLNSIPLYECAESESILPTYVVGRPATITTYPTYTYNVPGVLVTVTRVAGSSGRVAVDYTTTNVSAALPDVTLPARDISATNTDYTPVSGTLIFDDFEMSKTIMIPIAEFFSVGQQANRDFAIVLSNPRRDPYETTDVSDPRLDAPFSTAIVRILDVDTDPREGLLVTNIVGGTKTVLTNTIVTSVDYSTFQNIVTTITNVIGTSTNSVTNQVTFTYYDNRTFGGASIPNVIGISANATNFSFVFNVFNVTNFDGFATNRFVFTNVIGTATNFFGGVTNYVYTTYITNGFGQTSISNVIGASSNLFFNVSSVTNSLAGNIGVTSITNILGIASNSLSGGPYVSITFTNDFMGIIGETSILNVSDITNVVVTNIIGGLTVIVPKIPTNTVFNFQKANYRVPRDVGDVYGGQPVTIYVERFGTNAASKTLHYRVNSFRVTDPLISEQNNQFPLQPGSDYAVPTPATVGQILGTNSDFSIADGTINFPAANSPGGILQEINFTIPNNHLTEFNKDFTVQLYEIVNNSVQPVGEVNQTTVTILFDDQAPPAGSVDELYNSDYNTELALAVTNIPSTSPSDNLSPGAGGEVFGLALQSNDKTIVVGDFPSYNGIGRNCIARLNTDGSLDTSFNPLDGVDPFNGFIYSVALDSANKPVIGGSFTAFNGTARNNIARLNTNGSLDTSFNNQGSGADGTVWTVAVLSDNKVLIGGDFTHYNGVARNHIAQLNADGTLDTAFDPSPNAPDDSVYAIGLIPNSVSISRANATGTTTPAEDDRVFNVGANSGRLTVNYNMQQQTNRMQVSYGGVVIFDTGAVTNAGTFAVNFGPGVANNLLLIMNPGGALPGTNWNYTATVASTAGSPIYIGGNFMNVGSSSFSGIAKLNADGSLDASFNPGLGSDDTVYALGVLSDGSVVIGGAFTHVNGFSYNHLAKLGTDGAVDATFMLGTGGADNDVYSITPQNNGTIYVGGTFTSFNGTHRLGFTRLYSDGTVDTTFLDTAYNQFAGLPRIYFGDPLGRVLACGVQGDGNVMIGGSFNLVGGGQVNRHVKDNLDLAYGIDESFADLNLWAEPKSRDGVRIRNNVARLIGGATPGPGNVSLVPNGGSVFSVNKSGQFLPVELFRTNGALGSLSANFSIQAGTAQSGSDYIYSAAAPFYGIHWNYMGPPESRDHSDGLFGPNDILEDIYGYPWKDVPETLLSAVTVSLLPDTSVSGNLGANFHLANPAGADQFYLGGQNIPLGGALGLAAAPLTIIDDNKQAGTFGFASTSFIATNSSQRITLLRSNGIAGQVTIKASTSDGTAVVNTDYTRVSNQQLTFGPSVIINTNLVVTISQNSLIYTNTTEKYLNLNLSSLNPPVGYTASYGISNAQLRIINPNWHGYVTLSATNYTGKISSGSISFTVNRISGSKGTATVQYATTNGTAFSGVDYIGATNTLSWDSGDVSPRTVTIPLIQTFAVGAGKYFNVRLSNSTLNGSPTNLFFQMITNATLTISNDNSYGVLQLSAPVYTVGENGGSATITVVRTGGSANTVSLNYATSDGSNTVAGINYSNTSGTLTLAPGQLSTNFNVPIINDGTQDAPPTNFYFNVSLTNSVSAALGSLTNAQVQILDVQTYNEPPGSPDVGFDADGMNGDVLALALQSTGKIIAAGNFTKVGTVPFGHVARLNTDGTLDTGFLSGYAGANGSVLSLVNQTDDRVLVGGAFNFVDGVHRSFIARLMTDGSIDSSFNAGSSADNTVYSMAETFTTTGTNVNRKIYVGGAFGSFNGASSPAFVRLNNNGTVDTSFSVGLGADAPVYAIAAYPTNSVYAGKVLIGGAFAHFNGTNVNHFARVNADGSLDVVFNAALGSGADGDVHAIAIQNDGRILIGGNFAHFNGIAASRIVRLNADGSVDTNFVASIGSGANDTVEGIAVQPDNRIVLVGQFTQANGLTRNRITRLLPTGAADPTINFGDGANGDVASVVVQPTDGKIVIGGGFTEFDDLPHNRIARIYGNSTVGSGEFEFTSASYQVAENGIVALITVRRTDGTSGTNADGSGSVFVQFTTSAGTAVSGVNYSDVSTNIEFPAGEVLKTVTVPAFDDFTITADLTVNLALSNPTASAALGDQSTAVLTILNVDSAINFASSSYTQVKNVGTGLANIGIVRQGSTFGTSTVQFYTGTNGTAIAGTDYIPTNAIITFNPGDSTATVQVPIINNNLAEGNRTVELLLTNEIGSLLYAPSNAALTIIDTVNAPGQLYFAASNYVASESDPGITLTVVRTNGSSGTVSLSYNTVAGTAQPNINYTTTSGTVTFGNGETIKTATIPLVDNNLVQGPMNFSVALSNPTGGATLIDPTNAVVSINDNDCGVAFLNATNYVSETNNTGVIFVQRIGSTTNVFQVNYTTTNGTALAGINYNATTGTLAFVSGEIQKTISVPLINNQLVTNLTFGMKLSNPTVGAQLVAPSNAVVVLQAGAAGLSFTNAAMSVFKNVGSAAITVVCSNPGIEPVVVDSNTVPLSVHYYTVDGTAVAGQDYSSVSGTLIFTNGIGTNIIFVPIINNSLITGSRTFTVSLTNATAPGKITSPSNQVVTIIDSNSGLSFSSPTYSVTKTNVSATITVIRTDNTNTVSTIDFSTADGTAKAGTDYISTNGTCIFTNGVTSRTFAVTVLAGTTVQPDKTVLLQLSNPTGGILAPPSAATLTIHDTSGSFVVAAGSTLLHESLITNGIIDPGENVTMLFAFRAAGGTNVSSLFATLLATNGVTSPSPGTPVSYGPLIVGGPSASRALSFTANGTNSQQIVATFLLNNGVTNIGTASFTYTLGSWAMTFYNTNKITINDNTLASPYPSAITVSNLGGTVIKATITLTNMTHSSPSDINVLLVAPNQKDTLIMSHAGGQHALNGVTLKFDDAATNSLPQNSQITNGVYKPTGYTPSPNFP
ncbi:MAG TPA: Calx-beta domain-containing protein [Methylomirabilota bacterium]|nr:Calx-beta domain-containing protein [Methylomirabilota bacterium]